MTSIEVGVGYRSNDPIYIMYLSIRGRNKHPISDQFKMKRKSRTGLCTHKFCNRNLKYVRCCDQLGCFNILTVLFVEIIFHLLFELQLLLQAYGSLEKYFCDAGIL